MGRHHKCRCQKSKGLYAIKPICVQSHDDVILCQFDRAPLSNMTS
jgi:hypothetical protein